MTVVTGFGGSLLFSTSLLPQHMAESGKIVVRPLMKNKIGKQNGDYSIGAGFVEGDSILNEKVTQE